MIFPYFSMLMQEIDIRVEELNIYRLLEFINALFARMEPPPPAPTNNLTSGANSSATDVASNVSSGAVQTISPDEFKGMGWDLPVETLIKREAAVFSLPPSGLNKMYFKLLHIQPIAMNVSFSAQSGSRDEASKQKFDVNPLSWLMTFLEAGVGNIDAAPLRLNGKLIENALGTSETIIWTLVMHYVQQAVIEGYKILGSLECLGSPINLAGSLGSSAFDFFMLPAQGAMVSPEAFGTGLARGSAQLLKSSIGGVLNAASKVTSSASKGVAALSMDADFAQKSAAANQAAPKHALAGLTSGLKSLGRGVMGGVTGLFVDPFRGAQQGGVKGFAKGLGKGLLGLVAKPISGTLDFATQTLKGIGNTAGYLLDGDAPVLTHIRPKRFVDESGILKPYSLDEAQRLGRDRIKNEKKLKAAQEKQAAKAAAGEIAVASSS